MFKIIIAAIVGVFIVITAFMVIDPNSSTTSSTTDTSDSSSSSDTTNKMTVTIEGEVSKTGSYTFSADDEPTFEDLIDKAGGLTTKADERCFYYETELESGMTYYISSLYDSSDVCSKSEINKVNINEDDADELMEVSGFTSSIANAVVSYRSSNGTFTTIEQLTDVYGIGNATYRKVRNYVILHS